MVVMVSVEVDCAPNLAPIALKRGNRGFASTVRVF